MTYHYHKPTDKYSNFEHIGGPFGGAESKNFFGLAIARHNFGPPINSFVIRALLIIQPRGPRTPTKRGEEFAAPVRPYACRRL